MKNRKKGFAGGIAGVLIIILVVLLAFNIINDLLNKAFSSGINPLKEKLGLNTKEDKAKETRKQQVAKEIYANAKEVYQNMFKLISECITKNPQDRMCSCGSIITDALSNKHSILMLSAGNENSLSIEPPIAADSISKLPPVYLGLPDALRPADTYIYPDKISLQIKKYQSATYQFFINKMIGKIDGNSRELSSNQFYFNKIASDVIVVDTKSNGRLCGSVLNCQKQFIRNGVYSSKDYLDICLSISSNECYSNNNQYIQTNQQCTPLVPNDKIAGCMTSFIVTDTSINKQKLIESYTVYKDVRPNEYQKFAQYLYVLNLGSRDQFQTLLTNPAGTSEYDPVYIAIDKLRSKNLNAAVIFTNTAKPFDKVQTNGGSYFSNAILSRYQYDVILVVRDSDSIIEVLLSEKAVEKININKETCSSDLLNAFSSTTGPYGIKLALTLEKLNTMIK